MREGDFSVIDVETTGGSMDNIPVGFELLLTGARCGRTYAMYTSAPESLGQLADLLASFPGPVVTYNGARFDLPVLDDHFERLLGRRLKLKHHYDLMVEIERAAGRRISLDRLCLYTFGEEKVTLGHHRHYGRIWKEEPHRLADYNRRDLDLTHELFMRVLRGEPLFLGDTTVVLPAP
ncbi:MAG: ribonuclease H-like domain-containing protein [Chloroflexi bacterium]|nr:ribonuclease H-like domain-containing protein [Chloroflexota bacterium]